MYTEFMRLLKGIDSTLAYLGVVIALAMNHDRAIEISCYQFRTLARNTHADGNNFSTPKNGRSAAGTLTEPSAF